MPMEGADQLLTVAEIGAAFAGFTGVIGVLGHMPGARVPEITRVQFWLMIEFSLATVFFSLIPFAVFNFAGAAGIVWIVSSALMAAFIVVHVLVVFRVTRPLRRRGEWLPNPVTAVVLINFAAVCLVQALNAFGVGFQRSYAAYFLGLLLFLLIASINFIFLMRVVWSGGET